MVRWFLEHICTCTIFYDTGVHSSIDGEPLKPGPDTFSPGTGPIFIHRLNCPTGIPDNYDDAYVACLNEALLGQSACSHNDDIGIRCTGMHAESWKCIDMIVCDVFPIPIPVHVDH